MGPPRLRRRGVLLGLVNESLRRAKFALLEPDHGGEALGELLAHGKANLQAPWRGLAGFFTIALMLTLLILISEAVRDAFDPRIQIN